MGKMASQQQPVLRWHQPQVRAAAVSTLDVRLLFNLKHRTQRQSELRIAAPLEFWVGIAVWTCKFMQLYLSFGSMDLQTTLLNRDSFFPLFKHIPALPELAAWAQCTLKKRVPHQCIFQDSSWADSPLKCDLPLRRVYSATLSEGVSPWRAVTSCSSQVTCLRLLAPSHRKHHNLRQSNGWSSQRYHGQSHSSWPAVQPEQIPLRGCYNETDRIWDSKPISKTYLWHPEELVGYNSSNSMLGLKAKLCLIKSLKKHCDSSITRKLKLVP